ncbi:hypothetical protein QQF64_035107 [Cirrhinus molitorella]|uniref:Uncharacterized protein n=1 Tax=Cirrhinus molitorella TaxID=172907 RepID=A0ABR3NF27_9TELE
MDRYKKRNARLTRDGKRCLDASPCPRLLLGGRMPSFHSPPTHTNTSCLFRRKTRSFARPISVKLALVSLAERGLEALRVWFTMAIVSLERLVTVLEAGRGAAAARLLTPPPRGDIGGRGKPSCTII